ncbi:hypothetical protein [Pedobacter sp. PF22-3]|uniref:hypothetical protein n=1 Tax=Pedobacter sp. PF22-3 TaxID=2994467 RepID=UPI002245517B|nr:hypothetical protein [Pedobacter sp. PF22-3]
MGRFEEILTKNNVIKRTSRLKTTFEEVENIINFKLPKDYKNFVSNYLGFEGFIGEQYVKLWDFIVLKPILLYYWHQLFIFRGTNDQPKKCANQLKMEQRKLSELTNEELLQESKKKKSAAIMNALLIGFLAGIIFFSVAKNTLGFLTLIPLFFIYKLVNNSKYDNRELENLLKERGLK